MKKRFGLLIDIGAHRAPLQDKQPEEKIKKFPSSRFL